MVPPRPVAFGVCSSTPAMSRMPTITSRTTSAFRMLVIGLRQFTRACRPARGGERPELAGDRPARAAARVRQRRIDTGGGGAGGARRPDRGGGRGLGGDRRRADG